MGLFIKIKRRGRKIINHHIVEGTRESHPRVHDLQHPRLGKQIMDTRMGFPCPFHSVVIDSISPKVGHFVLFAYYGYFAMFIENCLIETKFNFWKKEE